jgi:hypothetical protein
MKSLSPWRANPEFIRDAPAFIKARIIGQSCSVMVNTVALAMKTAIAQAKALKRLQSALAQEPKKYACCWVIHLMLISKKQK